MQPMPLVNSATDTDPSTICIHIGQWFLRPFLHPFPLSSITQIYLLRPYRRPVREAITLAMEPLPRLLKTPMMPKPT